MAFIFLLVCVVLIIGIVAASCFLVSYYMKELHNQQNQITKLAAENEILKKQSKKDENDFIEKFNRELEQKKSNYSQQQSSNIDSYNRNSQFTGQANSSGNYSNNNQGFNQNLGMGAQNQAFNSGNRNMQGMGAQNQAFNHGNSNMQDMSVQNQTFNSGNRNMQGIGAQNQAFNHGNSNMQGIGAQNQAFNHGNSNMQGIGAQNQAFNHGSNNMQGMGAQNQAFNYGSNNMQGMGTQNQNNQTLSQSDVPDDNTLVGTVTPPVQNSAIVRENANQVSAEVIFPNAANESKPTPAVSEQPAEEVQEIKPNDDSCSLGDMFKLVRSLRENNPTYLQFNVVTGRMDLVSDESSAYILTSDNEVLPNKITNFNERYIHQDVYECDHNNITLDNRIIYCKVDDMYNIVKRGKIM